MSDLNLTDEHLAKITDDMEGKSEMLTSDEINIIAKKINEKINIPIINEEKEFIVFSKIIKIIDKKLYEMLPNEYYELIKDATDGVTQEEADMIRDRVTPLINEKVDIPIIDEKTEEKLIGYVLGLIMNAMVKGKSLSEE